MRRSFYTIISVYLLMLIIFFAGCNTNQKVIISENQVKIPLIVDVSHPIAGADISFENTSGLVFTNYEPSDAIRQASFTPIVEKNGKTRLGFYSIDNIFLPTNSKLDMGYLIFEYSGGKQSVTLTEIKLIEVVDKDTTNSEILITKIVNIDGNNNSYIWIIAAAILVMLIAISIIIINRKKLTNGLTKELDSELDSEFDSELDSEFDSELDSEFDSELDSELVSELDSEKED
ncbi:MAG: MSCRAMM family adhesin SdrC [Firmicutes bacterium]|nr:MSCRAMM family adhesin SdrC [Bacillota bacterium]